MRKQLIFPLLKEICEEEGIVFIEEPSRGMFGSLIFKNKRKFLVKDVNFNLNNVSSMRVAKNKALTSYFLEQFGYRTPEYTMVYSKTKCQQYDSSDTLGKGLEFAERIGYPVILKLNDSSKGNGIYKVYNGKELEDKAEQLLKEHDTFQVQRYYGYRDYRVVVLGQEIISAYQRIPLSVIGDGVRSIEQLIEEKQKEYRINGRDTVIKPDDEMMEILSRRGYDLNTKLQKGEGCVLRHVSNLSAGGECLDLTDRIHQSYKDLCIRIANDFNLKLSGIDIMCNNICEKADEYIILEINSAPGLDNYAFKGREQECYVKELYRKVLLFIEKELCGCADI